MDKELENKKLIRIKLIAKWFLAIQSIWILLLGFTVCYAFAGIIIANTLPVFVIMLLYFIALEILTSTVITKRLDLQSFTTAKIKLIIVFVLGIIPISIGFLPILLAIFSR